MADELRVTGSVRYQKDNVTYSRAWSYTADVSGTAKGPTPGAVAVSTDGTDINLSELTTPGPVVIQNQSEDYYVAVGVWDPDTSKFYPLFELLPGEYYPLRLSRDLFEQYAGTGTGTDTPNNTLRAKAFGGAAVLLVEALEA